jgi:hypothetical protein
MAPRLHGMAGVTRRRLRRLILAAATTAALGFPPAAGAACLHPDVRPSKDCCETRLAHLPCCATAACGLEEARAMAPGASLSGPSSMGLEPLAAVAVFGSAPALPFRFVRRPDRSPVLRL